MEPETVRFDFYGVTVTVVCPPPLAKDIADEFAYFAAQAGSDGCAARITIRAYRQRPSPEKIPPVKASMYQPDSISYDRGRIRYIDYRGQALSIYDYGTETGELYSESGDLLYELLYLMIHSRVGEHLDERGMHRVHALGLSVDGHGVLCLLPQGGGKTTLCLEALKQDGVRLLSDDIPLIGARGKLLPFPLRMGVSETDAAGIPERYLHRFNRRAYGTKMLVDMEYVRGRLSGVADVDTLLIGERENTDNARIEKTGKAPAFAALIKNGIIGLGLPQMVEYFLRTGLRDVVCKARLAGRRTKACMALVARAKTRRFVIGTDRARNAAVLVGYLDGLKKR